MAISGDIHFSGAVEEMERESSPGMPTAYEAVNGAVRGGWRPGKLHVVAARPGMGKSSFVEVDAVHQAGQGYRAYYHPAEMGWAAHARRMASREGVTEALKVVEWIWHHKGLFMPSRASRVVSEALGVAEKLRPDVVYIDYVQLLAPSGGARSRRDSIYDVVNEINDWAISTSTAVVLVAQLNRKIEHHSRDGGAPKMSDIAECGALEDLSSLILIPHRKSIMEGREGREVERAHIYIVKNRFGPVGAVPIKWSGSKVRYL